MGGGEEERRKTTLGREGNLDGIEEHRRRRLPVRKCGGSHVTRNEQRVDRGGADAPGKKRRSPETNKDIPVLTKDDMRDARRGGKTKDLHAATTA
eukprot:751403-Hanusia_phi.AAC.1